MIDPFEFQREASATIVSRYLDYLADPVITGTKKHPRPVPFFQALSSITASGKTVILADAVSEICSARSPAPVILWLSKGKVVVEQSYNNLLPGGKYHHLLGNMSVRALAQYDTEEVRSEPRPIVYFATVGTFNQKDKESGNLLIYRCDIDTAEQSTWDAIKNRLDPTDARRPLIVVYDEAHNLSDQQVDLLMELEPEAFLLASATMRLPGQLRQDVELLRQHGYGDDWLVTNVDAKAVADSGLVKNTVVLGGYRSPMEETVAQLIEDMREAEDDASKYGLAASPKAIYVSNTNIVAGDANRKDDPKQPFNQRQAPPILLWRYLTEQCGVDPSSIAVYCSLRFVRDFPPPEDFKLFKGGDRDYSDFTAGDYQHIIFNLSLQEGWDDPMCYFAYIDKSMDSRVQVEQVIGRTLRQPQAQHFAAERLNTAHFYIRVDRNQVFADVLDAVEEKLNSEAPEIRVIRKTPNKSRPVELTPRQECEVPGVAVRTEEAIKPIAKLIDQMTDYRNDDGTNTKARGSRSVVRRRVGTTASGEPTWEEFEQSNLVLARWIFTREVRHRHVGALGIAPTSADKFDAWVGLGSNADAHIRQVAQQVVEAYVEHAFLAQKSVDPYTVGPQLVVREDMEKYTNALHEGYDGLNALELEFARALDREGHLWARNLPRSGFGIPLVSLGPTTTFYPDFLVWRDDLVLAIDTKGGHLLAEAAARKLLTIKPSSSSPRLAVRLVSPGTYTKEAELEDRDGFTVWGVRHDGTRRVTQIGTMADVATEVLRD